MHLLLSHGAGAGSAHPWMQAWADRLAALGEVHAFDYPYMAAGRRLPDRMPALLEAHQAELGALRARLPASEADDIVLVGKSMGSRVACRVSAEAPVRAVVCLGYPLVGQSKKRPVRDAELHCLGAPCLLVQGERDPFSPPEILARVLASCSPPPVLHVVPDGDHSLMARKRSLRQLGRTQEDLDAEALEAIASFLRSTGP